MEKGQEMELILHSPLTSSQTRGLNEQSQTWSEQTEHVAIWEVQLWLRPAQFVFALLQGEFFQLLKPPRPGKGWGLFLLSKNIKS